MLEEIDNQQQSEEHHQVQKSFRAILYSDPYHKHPQSIFPDRRLVTLQKYLKRNVLLWQSEKDDPLDDLLQESILSVERSH